MSKISTPESIGEENKKLILKRLLLKGGMSRADLTRETRMSFPAVSSNIRHLLDKGYIIETGEGGNSLGRKSKLLSFNARRGFVMGIDIGRHEVRFMLADLLGNGLAARTRESRPEEGGSRFVGSIVTTAKQLLKSADTGGAGVLAVAVGIPGLVRDDKMFAAPYGADFSLKTLRDSLGKLFGADVLVENGINFGAIGESRRGVGARYSDFAYVGYGVGLGAALILNGALYRGVLGAAGEIGFMAVSPKHLRARFDEIGVLESLISRERIARSLPGKDFMAGMTGLLRDPRRVRGNRMLEDVARYFGMAMINIAAFINPQAILISGGIGRGLGEYFGTRWERMLENHLPYPPEIVFSKLNGREPLMGAVCTALEHVHAMPIAAEDA